MAPHDPSTGIDAVESSVNHLLSSWHRRRLFSCFLKPPQQAVTKRAPWRSSLAKFIDSLPVHIATILLILIDLTLTALDISSTLLSCAEEKPNKVHHVAEISILGILSAKVLALAIALGWEFFKSAGHVVDGVVMVGALVLEFVAEGKGAGLIVVVSLWRVIRVVESAFELSNEAIEAQVEGIITQFEALSAENRRLEGNLAEKDERIKELEEELKGVSCFPLRILSSVGNSTKLAMES